MDADMDRGLEGPEWEARTGREWEDRMALEWEARADRWEEVPGDRPRLRRGEEDTDAA